jgi:hypothetical protein
MGELRNRVQLTSGHLDIIAVTEVKPKNSRYTMQPADYQIEGYSHFTRNLDKEETRGIIIWIKNGLEAVEASIDVSGLFEEALRLDVSLKGEEHMLCGCIYRSPHSTTANSELLNETIRRVGDLKFSHVLIVGDFNYPGIDWENHNSGLHPEPFLTSCDDAFLHQHILEPTRGRLGQNSNLLDLVFSNEENMVTNIEYQSPLGKSDHSCILFDFICNKVTEESKKTIYLYDRANYTAMNEQFSSTDWDTELITDNGMTAMYNKFCAVYNQVVTQNVPSLKVTVNQRKSAPGITAEEASFIRKKNRLWTRYMETRSEVKYKQYTRARNKVKTIVRNAAKRKERNIAENIKTNPKTFWKYTKSRTHVQERIPALYMNAEMNKKTSSNEEKAETLGSFFASVFTREPEGELPEPEEKVFTSPAVSVSVRANDIEKKLKSLDPNKAMGPDGIHPRVLKNTAASLCTPLQMIFQHSLDTASLPSVWKEANVTALYKKGNKQVPNNYRPVSLTAVPCKILESFVREVLVTHMRDNNLFSEFQYGFRERRSTTLQLLHTVEDWMRSIDRGETIDACYLDLMKAFDSVPHKRLIVKLKSYGVEGRLLQWIENFLRNRTQQVFVEGKHSSAAQVLSGVPQGSVVGPTLFIIYINDMPDMVNSTIRLYADDAKLYRVIRNKQDEATLQRNLHSLHTWSAKWLLKFHPEKCHMMRLSTTTQSQLPAYKMNSCNGMVVLAWSVSERDLGVLVDSKLTFSEEISCRIKKANTVMGMIRRTFTYLDQKMFMCLYCSLVRPHLEYAASVWSPMWKKEVEAIERVQRRATRQIPGFGNLTYEERLRKLQLPTLYFRRLRGDMVETYKIMTSKYDIDPKEFFEAETTSRTRGHSLKLKKTAAATSRRQNSYSYRVVNCWNALPAEVVNAASTNSFKNRLDKHWADHPAKYNPNYQ